MISVLVHAGGDTLEGTLHKKLSPANFVPVTHEEYARGDIDLDGIFYLLDDNGEFLSVNGWQCVVELTD